MEQDIIKNYNCPVKTEYCQIHSVSYKGKCPFCEKGINPRKKEIADQKVEKIIPTEKICSHCNQLKSIEEFCTNIKNNDNHDGFCRECRSEVNRKYREQKKSKEVKSVDKSKISQEVDR